MGYSWCRIHRIGLNEQFLQKKKKSFTRMMTMLLIKHCREIYCEYNGLCECTNLAREAPFVFFFIHTSSGAVRWNYWNKRIHNLSGCLYKHRFQSMLNKKRHEIFKLLFFYSGKSSVYCKKVGYSTGKLYKT